MSQQLDDIRDTILRAFERVRYPDEPVVLSGDGDGLVRAFTRKDWRDIAAEDLAFAALPFFTPAGFHYFLPAFMLASLEPSASAIRQNLLRSLQAPADGASGDVQKQQAAERRRLFTDTQAAAVSDFLKGMVAVYGHELTKRQWERLTIHANPWWETPSRS